MDIEVIDNSTEVMNSPKGPLLMITNHPFGIIDGLIMCSLAANVRDDFKIITHETLQFIPELDKYILPIDFNEKSKIQLKIILKLPKRQKNIY